MKAIKSVTLPGTRLASHVIQTNTASQVDGVCVCVRRRKSKWKSMKCNEVCMYFNFEQVSATSYKVMLQLLAPSSRVRKLHPLIFQFVYFIIIIVVVVTRLVLSPECNVFHCNYKTHVMYSVDLHINEIYTLCAASRSVTHPTGNLGPWLAADILLFEYEPQASSCRHHHHMTHYIIVLLFGGVRVRLHQTLKKIKYTLHLVIRIRQFTPWEKLG